MSQSNLRMTPIRMIPIRANRSSTLAVGKLIEALRRTGREGEARIIQSRLVEVE
jgi:hypothetical protein